MFSYSNLILLISWLNSPPVLIVPVLLGTLYVWSCFLVCTFISGAIQYLSIKFAFVYIVHNRLLLLQLETNRTKQRGWGIYPLCSTLETRLIKYEHRLLSWCISSGAGTCFNPEYLLWGNFNENSECWFHFLSTKRSRHSLCITFRVGIEWVFKRTRRHSWAAPNTRNGDAKDWGYGREAEKLSASILD